MCGGRPPAAPLPSRRPTSLAADTAGAAPTWAFFTTPSRAVARLAPANLPAALLKRVVGRSLSPSVLRACAVACRQRRGVGAGSRRGSVGRSCAGCVGRAPSARGARRAGTRYACRYRRAYRPHGRWAPARRPAAQRRRPTTLAADTAGAALNLGVVVHAVACRRAPRFSAPASGAAEAGRWAVPQPRTLPGMRVPCRQGRGVGAGSRRGSVGRSCEAALGGRHRVRRAAGRRGAAGHTRRAYRPHVRWAPARRPAAMVAAQPRSQQTPLARPEPGRFLHPCHVPSRASLHQSCQRRC